MLRDDLLKKWSEYWGARPKGALLANEYKRDGLIPLLNKVLENDKAEFWEPIEPDIILAIYPEDYFPFLPSHYKLIYESQGHKAKREAREALKKEKGKLPDDSYTFMVFVDAYNFMGAGAYYGQGLSMQLIVNRKDLEAFKTCLEREYEEFKERFQVERWVEDNT